jgi:hypothetical protein
MKNYPALTRGEMKNVFGGLRDVGDIPPVVICDASNGLLYHSECQTGGYILNANNEYEWTSHQHHNASTWDSLAPCGGQCPGSCTQFYACEGVA